MSFTSTDRIGIRNTVMVSVCAMFVCVCRREKKKTKTGNPGILLDCLVT